MEKGLAKLAQEEGQAEVAAPEQPMNNDSTTITCLSDCIYAQNPEKTCMLKNITLNMSKEGSFECGQYSPAQEQMSETQQTPMDQSTGQKPVQESESKSTGLNKLKK